MRRGSIQAERRPSGDLVAHCAEIGHAADRRRRVGGDLIAQRCAVGGHRAVDPGEPIGGAAAQIHDEHVGLAERQVAVEDAALAGDETVAAIGRVAGEVDIALDRAGVDDRGSVDPRRALRRADGHGAPTDHAAGLVEERAAGYHRGAGREDQAAVAQRAAGLANPDIGAVDRAGVLDASGGPGLEGERGAGGRADRAAVGERAPVIHDGIAGRGYRAAVREVDIAADAHRVADDVDRPGIVERHAVQGNGGAGDGAVAGVIAGDRSEVGELEAVAVAQLQPEIAVRDQRGAVDHGAATRKPQRSRPGEAVGHGRRRIRGRGDVQMVEAWDGDGGRDRGVAADVDDESVIARAAVDGSGHAGEQRAVFDDGMERVVSGAEDQVAVDRAGGRIDHAVGDIVGRGRPDQDVTVDRARINQLQRAVSGTDRDTVAARANAAARFVGQVDADPVDGDAGAGVGNRPAVDQAVIIPDPGQGRGRAARRDGPAVPECRRGPDIARHLTVDGAVLPAVDRTLVVQTGEDAADRADHARLLVEDVEIGAPAGRALDRIAAGPADRAAVVQRQGGRTIGIGGRDGHRDAGRAGDAAAGADGQFERFGSIGARIERPGAEFDAILPDPPDRAVGDDRCGVGVGRGALARDEQRGRCRRRQHAVFADLDIGAVGPDDQAIGLFPVAPRRLIGHRGIGRAFRRCGGARESRDRQRAGAQRVAAGALPRRENSHSPPESTGSMNTALELVQPRAEIAPKILRLCTALQIEGVRPPAWFHAPRGKGPAFLAGPWDASLFRRDRAAARSASGPPDPVRLKAADRQAALRRSRYIRRNIGRRSGRRALARRNSPCVA